MQLEIEKVFEIEGYRNCRVQPEEVKVYYKYFEEGFHVVMVIDMEKECWMTPEQHEKIENKIMNLFYHPYEWLRDFPDGFPVYHVEVLTLLLGGLKEPVKRLCMSCRNTWIYLMPEKRLIIYENQPGDFWGLKNAIEAHYSTAAAKNSIKISLTDRIKSIAGLHYITVGIVFFNVLIYLILELIGNTSDPLFMANHGGMHPIFIRDGGQWWRILTASFLHFGLDHLINNMVIFCCVGSRLERAVGHVKLVVIYLSSAIGGGLLSYYVMLWTGDYAVSAGASGAVFGIIGGLLWAVIYHRGHFEGLTTRGMILMAALSLYYGFSTIGVDNWCHIGGILTGFLTAAILYHRKWQNC